MLLLIDNVLQGQQLDALLPACFSKGSTLIITSRCPGLPEYTSWEQVGVWHHCKV